MGHTLIALALPGVDVVHKVSIIPRGIGSLGYTIQRPIEDRFLMTREELEHKLMVLLGGRSAEHVVFDQLSTGAADDLARATDIARSMVTRYGMDAELGLATYETERQSYLGMAPAQEARNFSEATAEAIDAAVRKIISDAFERAVAILEQHRAVLDEGAALLLSKETLNEADLESLKNELPIAAAAPRNEPGA
jgi:cell division protease FtsH